jgi:hypothetical protein
VHTSYLAFSRAGTQLNQSQYANMATKHRAEARCWPAPQSQSKMMDDTVEPHRPARPHEKHGLVEALGKNPSSAMRRAAAKQNRRVTTRITAAMFDRCRRDRRLAPSPNAMRRAARQRPLPDAEIDDDRTRGFLRAPNSSGIWLLSAPSTCWGWRLLLRCGVQFCTDVRWKGTHPQGGTAPKSQLQWRDTRLPRKAF